MTYFKFNTKKQAFDFIQKVNKGENIQPTEDNTTTSYAQPIDFLGVFYVIADDVTKKYTDAEAFDPFAPIDYTPPTLSNIGVIIPEKFEWVFANDRFEINGFVVDFARVNGQLAVDVAYLAWEAFQNELDLPTNATVKASLMPIWRHVETEFENGNIIKL